MYDMPTVFFAKIITAIGQCIAKFIENNLTFSVIVVSVHGKLLIISVSMLKQKWSVVNL